MIGKVFGRLTVLAFSHKDKWRKNYWLCLCSCGKKVIVAERSLLTGNTKSCGCYRKQYSILKHLIHGRQGTRLYAIWQNMKNRCRNTKVPAYKDYGGRGITVCDEWLDFTCFMDWALNNGYDDSLSLDRINNNAGYKPSNCRWVTQKEQARNTRANVLITYKCDTLCVVAMAEKYNVNPKLLYGRLEKGWPVDRAIEEPVQVHCLHKRSKRC